MPETAMGETARNEEIEAETFKQSQRDYGFEKNPSVLLQEEKVKIKKRLLEIENSEGIPQRKEKELQQEISRRRINFNQLKREKEISNQILKSNFEQNTHINSSGVIVMGY